MISFPLLKQTIKSNLVVFLIFVAVLTMYITIIIGMYDPSVEATMAALLESLPPEFISAFGFTASGGSLISFLASYLYGFLLILMPMVYSIIVCNRLIALHVDRGSMSYLLSTPNSRLKIAMTQLVVLISSLLVLFAYITILGLACSHFAFPGELDVSGFILLNVGAFFLHLALSSIGFLASCISDDTRLSLGIGAGIPVAFFLLQMLAKANDKLDAFKYTTIFTLFSPDEILAQSSNGFIMMGALLIIGLVCYYIGIWRFTKRDLPL